MFFENWHCVLSWYTCTKTVGEADLMFVLIKNVHLVGITIGVRPVVICAILGLNVYSCEEVKQGRGVMPEKRIYGCENGA
jgi:hypothetical protein